MAAQPAPAMPDNPSSHCAPGESFPWAVRAEIPNGPPVTPSSAIAVASHSLSLAVARLRAATRLRELLELERARPCDLRRFHGVDLAIGPVDDRMPSLTDVEELRAGAAGFGRVDPLLFPAVSLRHPKAFT